MAAGLAFTAAMIVLMRAHVVAPETFAEPLLDSFLGIPGAGHRRGRDAAHFALTVGVSLATPPPPARVQARVEQIRYPRQLTDAELAD